MLRIFWVLYQWEVFTGNYQQVLYQIKKFEEEAEAMKSSMTDAQKAMIADFEKHFPKSRLIEESKKQ